MAHDTFRAGDLTAVIGDNSASGTHRAGYNGVWSLVHRQEAANLFVPTVSGLNLEHIFDGHRGDADTSRKIFFEPRNAPMSFRKMSATEAELHQPPTPTFHLESWTRFNLTAPHYLDMTFRFRPTQHVFQHGYIGLFWASYMHGPEDKSMYFRHGGLWHQLCTPRHNDQSTVRHRDDRLELEFNDLTKPALFKSLSRLRYELPLFYGHFGDLIWIVMFDRSEGLRLTHSPSGGGTNTERRTTNPAWDFQWIISPYDVLKPYELRVRAVLRPSCPRDEIIEEYNRWRTTP
jgi:hypothetical protein